MTSPAMLDVRGMRCPWPALRVARLMRESDRIDVLIDDDFAIGEVTALAASQGWTHAAAKDGENHLISLEKAAPA
jgi:tRNA 2-thiouridine synthesizing protein A